MILKMVRYYLFFISASMAYNQVTEAEVEGWEAHISRNTSNYIFPDKTTILIKPDGLCKSHALLMVVVCSSLNNSKERDDIRKSWGMEKNILGHPISVYFLLGKSNDSSVQIKIDKESDEHKDIIQEDFIDIYSNLTIKSLMLLKLIKNECMHSVKYVMKTDDDVFVNLVNLVKTLLQMKNTRRVLFGRLLGGCKPFKAFRHKWYAPKYTYRARMYPNFLAGAAYVMSIDAAAILYNKALHCPLFHLEDVYLTGICARFAGIQATHNGNFNSQSIRFDPCLYQTLITSHYHTYNSIRELHFKVNRLNLKEMCRIQKEAEMY